MSLSQSPVFAREWRSEYLETEPIPPPATCYGFLLSLVGETNRRRHIGCRVTATRLLARKSVSCCAQSGGVKKTPLGSPGNTRPDYQQLLTGIRLIMWIDSTDESGASEPTLESRVRLVLEHPASINRFGGLSLGESTHLVDEVRLWNTTGDRGMAEPVDTFLQDVRGRITLPVWVDHVGSAGTRYATGNLEPTKDAQAPEVARMPQISPEVSS